MIDFKGHRVEKDIILLWVRWYRAYPLSYRNLEDMMEERGVQVRLKKRRDLLDWFLLGSPLLAFRAQDHLVDLEHAGAGEHLRRWPVAMGNAERLTIGPVPEGLLAFPIRLHQVIALLRLLFPLARLVVETALHRAQYLVLNEPWRAVDEMRAVAEAIFKFGFVSWGNGNAVSHDEHDRSSCSQYPYPLYTLPGRQRRIFITAFIKSKWWG